MSVSLTKQNESYCKSIYFLMILLSTWVVNVTRTSHICVGIVNDFILLRLVKPPLLSLSRGRYKTRETCIISGFTMFKYLHDHALQKWMQIKWHHDYQEKDLWIVIYMALLLSSLGIHFLDYNHNVKKLCACMWNVR